MNSATHALDERDGLLPWVTLVTPAYNQSEFLAETIDSVLAQDYPKLEYIVLDDGSTDATPDVLSRYDGRISHDRHSNIGQSRTLNRGWSMARGSLIGYLSSDDLLEPSAVSRLVTALQANPDAAVAYVDYKLIDAKSRSFREIKAEDFDARRLCVDLVCQPGPGTLMRRKVFDQTGGWSPRFQQVPDFEFWLRASRFGRFIRIPEQLARYRIHEGSATFRAMTQERSVEIIEVMAHYWQASNTRDAKQSVANAHLIAAKNSVQAGRVTQALAHWFSACQLRPAIVILPRVWRMLLSGYLRRFAFSLFGRGQ
jgi:glycosyltransferase involved in cell wall biosynthesis